MIMLDEGVATEAPLVLLKTMKLNSASVNGSENASPVSSFVTTWPSSSAMDWNMASEA